jgi:response regulator RpfG family c-di-GMP phosphodiesterase
VSKINPHYLHIKLPYACFDGQALNWSIHKLMDSGKTILIVDDDQDFHILLGKVLQHSGYQVKSLFEGTVNKIVSCAKKCHMVLLDIELPGDSGVDVGRQLKSDPNTENIPVILISGHTEGEQHFTMSHADVFIQKPFVLSGLLKKINEILNLSGNDQKQVIAN